MREGQTIFSAKETIARIIGGGKHYQKHSRGKNNAIFGGGAKDSTLSNRYCRRRKTQKRFSQGGDTTNVYV